MNWSGRTPFACPLWVDAVDKVGDEQRAGNNRIQVPSFLNRYCAPDSYLDSMLLTRPSKNVYRQHRSVADMMARSRHVRFTPDSGHSSVQVGCPKSAMSRHSASSDRQHGEDRLTRYREGDHSGRASAIGTKNYLHAVSRIFCARTVGGVLGCSTSPSGRSGSVGSRWMPWHPGSRT
jgi:hypothetical protein